MFFGLWSPGHRHRHRRSPPPCICSCTRHAFPHTSCGTRDKNGAIGRCCARCDITCSSVSPGTALGVILPYNSHIVPSGSSQRHQQRADTRLSTCLSSRSPLGAQVSVSQSTEVARLQTALGSSQANQTFS
jgi:hypothetical protein